MAAKKNRQTRAGQGCGDSCGEGDPCAFRIVLAIRKLIRAVDIDSRKLAAEHQVTGPQLMSLMAVAEKSTVTSAEIAHRVHLSPSTIVGVIDRLESKGFVRRQRSTEDRRVVGISATDKGRQLLAHTPFPLQHTLSRTMAGLSHAECQRIAVALERLVELTHASDIDAAPILEIAGLREE